MPLYFLLLQLQMYFNSLKPFVIVGAARGMNSIRAFHKRFLRTFIILTQDARYLDTGR
ncbi:MAG: hypothetical protein JWQ38_3158 [Flavipsychrobacter sp.]|nr:hypothetical protein [Flavipsychrobacter sp.]